MGRHFFDLAIRTYYCHLYHANEREVIKSIYKKIPTFFTSNNSIYKCPCNNCIIKAICTRRCDELIGYVNIIINDYCERMTATEIKEKVNQLNMGEI